MSTLGSSSNPTWAGWDAPGAGYAFACQYNCPAFDILVSSISAYFAPTQANNHGWVCIWRKSDAALLASVDLGVIASGTLAAGGQAWHTGTIPGGLVLAASSQIWIGGYTKSSLVFSTYDTSPATYYVNMGTSGPGPLTPGTNTNQGPCGAYCTYGQVFSTGAATLGNPPNSGIARRAAQVILRTGVVQTGGSGDVVTNNPSIIGNLTTKPGGSGGLAPVTTNAKHATLWIWRP